MPTPVPPDAPPSGLAPAGLPSDPDLEARIAAVNAVIASIEPGVGSHGGTIELIEVRYTRGDDAKTEVEVDLGGGCSGCGAKLSTLTAVKYRLERTFQARNFYEPVYVQSAGFRL